VSLQARPASDADAEALASFLRSDPPATTLSLDQLVRDLPGYLIRLRLQLRLDGQPIAEAGPLSLGQALRGELIHTAPQLGEHRYPWHPVAGEQLQLGWDLQGGLESAMMDADARLQAADSAPPEQLPAALLQAGLTGYLYANDQYNRLQATIAQAALYRTPSFAACGTVLETDLLFGLPRSVYLAGLGLDVAHLDVQAADNAGDPQRSARLVRQTGQLGAELAHATLEGLLAGREPGVSAPRAQAAALDQGLRLYTLEADTVDSILFLLDIDPATAETARNAALATNKQTPTV